MQKSTISEKELIMKNTLNHYKMKFKVNSATYFLILSFLFMRAEKSKKKVCRKKHSIKYIYQKTTQAVVVHSFNPNTWEPEAGRFVRSRPDWSTK